MSPLIQSLVITFVSSLVNLVNTEAQALVVEGSATVGEAGEGKELLKLNSERAWVFRQFNVGPSTALELADLTGLKNFIINTTANVGIGIQLPADKLHVNGNIRAMGSRISFGTSEYFEDGGGFIINCNGALISTFDGADDLGSSAKRWRNIWATGGTINTSDIRDKDNIKGIDYGLEALLKLRPVSFTWKNNSSQGRKLGLIAQEVMTIIPEVVVDSIYSREEDGANQKLLSTHLGLYYSDLIPVLIRSIQQQQVIIDEQKIRLTNLEAQVRYSQEMDSRLSRLEAKVSELK